MFGAPIRATNEIERQQQGSQTTQILDAGCTTNEAAPPSMPPSPPRVSLNVEPGKAGCGNGLALAWAAG